MALAEGDPSEVHAAKCLFSLLAHIAIHLSNKPTSNEKSLVNNFKNIATQACNKKLIMKRCLSLSEQWLTTNFS